MGTCQSSPHRDGEVDLHAPVSAGKNVGRRRTTVANIIDTACKPHKQLRVALVSPSERTGATEVPTPFSVGAEEGFEVHDYGNYDDGFEGYERSSDEEAAGDIRLTPSSLYVDTGEWDEMADLPPLHIDDEAMRRIRERLAHVLGHDDDDYDDDAKGGASSLTNHNAHSPTMNRTASRPDTPVLDLKKPSFSGRMARLPKDGGDPVVVVPGTTPLVAPPKDAVVAFDSNASPVKTSVNPQAIASFNKLKIQADLAAKAEEQRKRKEKVQDRRIDIGGYKDLWNSYQNIQEQMQDTKLDAFKGGRSDGLLLNNPSTWFIDFGAMSALTHLDDQDEADDDYHNNYDNNYGKVQNQSSFSCLSQAEQNSQKQLYQRIAMERRKKSGAYSIGSQSGGLFLGERHSSNLSESTILTTTSCGFLQMSSLPMMVVEDKAEKEEEEQSDLSEPESTSLSGDYSVPSQSAKASHSNRGTSSEQQSTRGLSQLYAFEKQTPAYLLNRDAMEDSVGFLDAPTPVASNQGGDPMSSYVADYLLPSVQIDNSGTGVVRWREFPDSGKVQTPRRKLDFSCDTSQLDNGEASQESSNYVSTEPLDISNDRKPKIKTYDPKITFLSSEAFLKMAR